MAALLITGASLSSLWLAATKGVDAARLYLANALLFAMSFMLAATLVKIIGLGDWNAIAHFAVIFCLRTLIKLTLKGERHEALGSRL